MQCKQILFFLKLIKLYLFVQITINFIKELQLLFQAFYVTFIFRRYFFCVIVAVVCIGLVNGLFFLPVLLSLIGPAAEVVPLSHPDRISTPSPEPVRRVHAPKCRVAPPPRRHTQPHQCHREPSLTTITEEPSWHSQTHEGSEPTQTIVVEPEFVVETTCTHPHVSIFI